MGGGELSGKPCEMLGGGGYPCDELAFHTWKSSSISGRWGWGEKDGQLAQIYSLASKADLLNEKTTIIV